MGAAAKAQLWQQQQAGKRWQLQRECVYGTVLSEVENISSIGDKQRTALKAFLCSRVALVKVELKPAAQRSSMWCGDARRGARSAGLLPNNSTVKTFDSVINTRFHQSPMSYFFFFFFFFCTYEIIANDL